MRKKKGVSEMVNLVNRMFVPQCGRFNHIVKLYRVEKKKENNFLTEKDDEELGILMMTRSLIVILKHEDQAVELEIG